MDEDFLKAMTVPFNTPDIAQLERKSNHLLFDCGQVNKTKDIACPAYSTQRMSMFIRNRDNLVIPIRSPEFPKARIGGTLYKVARDELIKLDRQLRNRVLFERREVFVYIPYLNAEGDVQLLSNEDGKPEPVWFYQAIPDSWVEPIEMSRTKYNVPRTIPEYRLAKNYQHNWPIFHNHFRASDASSEALRSPVPVKQATPSVVAHVKKKNDAAVRTSIMQKMRLANELKRYQEMFKPVPEEVVDTDPHVVIFQNGRVIKRNLNE